MKPLLIFHAVAAARGDGLRPELLAALARTAALPHSGMTVRSDGMVQSGPDPASNQAADVMPFPRPKRIREPAT
jgi:hypothetical protein